jgi:hypothetical protein
MLAYRRRYRRGSMINGLFRASPHAYTPSMAFTLVIPTPSGPRALHPIADGEAEFEISSGGVLTITYPDKSSRHLAVGQWIEVAVNTGTIS